MFGRFAHIGHMRGPEVFQEGPVRERVERLPGVARASGTEDPHSVTAELHEFNRGGAGLLRIKPDLVFQQECRSSVDKLAPCDE